MSRRKPVLLLSIVLITATALPSARNGVVAREDGYFSVKKQNAKKVFPDLNRAVRRYAPVHPDRRSSRRTRTPPKG
jgi:hypothetical protein